MKFHSNPVFWQKYIKSKVKEFNSAINTNFWDHKIAKEGVYHTFIAYISIVSAMKMDKKNYRQAYLEEASIK